ncbi:MAG: helix-turn-helix domain-containing protein [Kiritimatiellia bacterium]
MLRENGLTAAEIAYRTGFANPHHFARIFKKYQGESTGRYRQRQWSKPG